MLTLGECSAPSNFLAALDVLWIFTHKAMFFSVKIPSSPAFSANGPKAWELSEMVPSASMIVV